MQRWGDVTGEAMLREWHRAIGTTAPRRDPTPAELDELQRALEGHRTGASAALPLATDPSALDRRVRRLEFAFQLSLTCRDEDVLRLLAVVLGGGPAAWNVLADRLEELGHPAAAGARELSKG